MASRKKAAAKKADEKEAPDAVVKGGGSPSGELASGSVEPLVSDDVKGNVYRADMGESLP